MNISMKEHWNEIYEALDIDELPWYEEIETIITVVIGKTRLKLEQEFNIFDTMPIQLVSKSFWLIAP